MAIGTKAQWTDYGAWAGVNLSQDLSKDWSYSLETNARFDYDVSRLGSALLDAGVQRELNDHFEAGTIIRLGISRNSENLLDSYRRASAEIKWRLNKKGPLDYSLRARAQIASKGMTSTPASTEFNTALRIRPRMTYKISKGLRTAIALEVFMRPEKQGLFWSDTRVRITIMKKVSKRRWINISYQFEREKNTADPWTEHTIICSYEIERKRRKKED